MTLEQHVISNVKKSVKELKKMLKSKHGNNAQGGSEWKLNVDDVKKIENLMTSSERLIRELEASKWGVAHRLINGGEREN